MDTCNTNIIKEKNFTEKYEIGVKEVRIILKKARRNSK
jgi:hypothetical protein